MSKKNIVYFFCDELRPDALGCYGNPVGKMQTPNIDSIAQIGTLFENCFCNSPVCVPSRTSLLTSRYPEETGVFENEAAFPGYRMENPPITFPEILKAKGYHTANFGKTHLPQQLHPFEIDNQEGSEMSLGLSPQERKSLTKLIPRRGINFNAASLYPDDKDYYPEKVVTNALQWMKVQHDPYFVRISFTQPHSPIILRKGYEKIYADYHFTGKLPDISQLSYFEKAFAEACGFNSFSEEEIIKTKVYYYGLAAWVDDQVGKVMDFLKTTHQIENTIIIFNADHGALRGESQGLGKHIFNRAAQAVPLIIAAPEKGPGKREKKLCSNIDIAPTLLNLINLKSPSSFKGVDLFSNIQKDEVYATIGYGETESCAFPMRNLGRLSATEGWPRRACIRTTKYRLDMNIRINGQYVNPDKEDIFFVDYSKNSEEDHNMIKEPQYISIADHLRKKLLKHCLPCVEPDPQMLHIPENSSLLAKQ